MLKKIKTLWEKPFTQCESEKFIYWRIEQKNYRGIPSPQHNRFDQNQLKSFTKAYLSKNNKNEWIKFPKGDDGNQYNYDANKYKEYLEILNNIKTPKGYKKTSNALRKNWFSDFEKMQVIERKKWIDKENYFRLSPNFFRKISNFPEIDKIKNYEWDDIYKDLVFSNLLNTLGILNPLLETITKCENYIDIYEYTFFFTWYKQTNYFKKNISEEIDYKTSIEDIVCLIKDWRTISFKIKESIIRKIK